MKLRSNRFSITGMENEFMATWEQWRRLFIGDLISTQVGRVKCSHTVQSGSGPWDEDGWAADKSLKCFNLISNCVIKTQRWQRFVIHHCWWRFPPEFLEDSHDPPSFKLLLHIMTFIYFIRCQTRPRNVCTVAAWGRRPVNHDAYILIYVYCMTKWSEMLSRCFSRFCLHHVFI